MDNVILAHLQDSPIVPHDDAADIDGPLSRRAKPRSTGLNLPQLGTPCPHVGLVGRQPPLLPFHTHCGSWGNLFSHCRPGRKNNRADQNPNHSSAAQISSWDIFACLPNVHSKRKHQ